MGEIQPDLVAEFQTSLKKRGVNAEIETLVAGVILHEISHQFVTRMHRYYKGLNDGQPSFMDNEGHLNSNKNLMVNGNTWLAFMVADPKSFMEMYKMDAQTKKYWSVYQYCTAHGCTASSDPKVWCQKGLEYFKNLKK
jgi:hypothetical protein